MKCSTFTLVYDWHEGNTFIRVVKKNKRAHNMACKIDAFVTRSENENEKGLHEIAVERERIIKGKKITLRRLEKKQSVALHMSEYECEISSFLW